jgi:hypothetical protein
MSLLLLILVVAPEFNSESISSLLIRYDTPKHSLVITR